MKNNFSKWDVGGGSRSIIQGLNLFTSRNLFKSLKSILMVVALLSLSSNVWGADVVAYTLTPASGTNNSYAGNCDVAIGGITWNIIGNSQMQPWRIGGKSLSQADRWVYSKTAIEDNITSIVVEHGTAKSTTVNSFKLEVYSTAAKAESGGTGDVSSISGTFTASNTTTFTRPNGVDWSNRFYRFAYKVTISSSSNQYFQFSSATFYKAAAPACAAPTSPTNGTTTKNSQVVSWTSSESTFEVFCSTSSTDPASNATPTATVTAKTHTFTGLNANTTYYWWVRTKCSESSKSAWVKGTSFKTASVTYTDLFPELLLRYFPAINVTV